MKQSTACSWLLLSFFLVFFNCVDKGNNPTPNAESLFRPSVAYTSDWYDLLRRGDTLSVIVSSCECDRGHWERTSKIQNFPFVFDQVQVTIQWSTMSKVGNDSNRVVFYKRFHKLDSEGSIFGGYERDSTYYLLEKPVSDSLRAGVEKMLGYEESMYQWMRIDSTRLWFFHDNAKKQSFKQLFLSEYSTNYAGKVNVTVDTSSVGLITLVGQVSGDTLLITQNDSGGIKTTWKNESFEYDPLVSMCPHPKYPDWLETGFYTANAIPK
jgi:hypothetical protein